MVIILKEINGELVFTPTLHYEQDMAQGQSLNGVVLVWI